MSAFDVELMTVSKYVNNFFAQFYRAKVLV